MKEFGKEPTRLAMGDIVNKFEFNIGIIKDSNIKKK